MVEVKLFEYIGVIYSVLSRILCCVYNTTATSCVAFRVVAFGIMFAPCVMATFITSYLTWIVSGTGLLHYRSTSSLKLELETPLSLGFTPFARIASCGQMLHWVLKVIHHKNVVSSCLHLVDSYGIAAACSWSVKDTSKIQLWTHLKNHKQHHMVNQLFTYTCTLNCTAIRCWNYDAM